MDSLVDRLLRKQVPRFSNSTGRPPRMAGFALDPDCQEAAAEIERLRADAASFHMAYRVKCDKETKRQAVEIERLRMSLGAIHHRVCHGAALGMGESVARECEDAWPELKALRPNTATPTA